MSLQLIQQEILKYFSELDSALYKLSHKNEGKTSNLPPWTLTMRALDLYVGPGEGIFVLIARPVHEEVTPQFFHYNSDLELLNDVSLASGMDISGILPSAAGYSALYGFAIEEVGALGKVIAKNNSLTVLARGQFGMYRYFNTRNALEDALNFWNNAIGQYQQSKGYVAHVQDSIARLMALIDQPKFKERPIHRFINEHHHIFLPPHIDFVFEAVINDSQSKKQWVADFILKNEEGLPPVLIELESTSRKVLTTQGHRSAPTNHAIAQIEDWAVSIRTNPKTQTPELDFLTQYHGILNKMVIIGRTTSGFIAEKLDEMNRNSDITIWTYDDLIDRAILRVNSNLVQQAKIIGLDDPPAVNRLIGTTHLVRMPNR